MTAESGDTVADRRLHPATIVVDAVRRGLLPWFIPAAVFLLTQVRGGRGWGPLAAVPATIMLALIGAMISFAVTGFLWTRFRYGVGTRDIVIESGVFTKVRRSIPLSRVQDVSIEQGPIGRLFGVVKVRIETGGGEKDEGLLDSVSVAEADRLRRIVRGGGVELEAPLNTEIAQVAGADGVVFKMTGGRVFLSGLFNFSLLYLAGAYAALQATGIRLPFQVWSPRTWERFAGPAGMVMLAWLIAATLTVGVLFGIARTVMRDYGFTLTRDSGKLIRARGFLTRSEAVVPLNKVQLAKVHTGPLRRKLGWFDLSLQTLGADTAGKTRESMAPFARREEILRVMAEAGLTRLPEQGELTKVSSRRLLTKLAPLVIPVLAVGTVSLFIPFATLLLIVVAGFAIHAMLEWRMHRYLLEDGILYVRRGVWRQRLWIAPAGAFQTLSFSRSVLQRWFGLGSLRIDTAGASAIDPLRIDNIGEDRARTLIEQIRAAASPKPPAARRHRTPKTTSAPESGRAKAARPARQQ